MEARTFLDRVGFGVVPDDVTPLIGRRRDAIVDGLLASMITAPSLPPPDVATAAFSFAAPNARDESAVVAGVADDTGTDAASLKPVGRALAARLGQRGLALKAWWLEEMITSPSPLTERVVLTFHDHFTSSLKKVKDPRLLYRQNALFFAHAGGSYSDLLHAIVHDAAMLRYLDAAGSTKAAPNENLARELLELFTLGEGHYTEADVKAAARALTGVAVRRVDGAVVQRRRHHDHGQKTFLGSTGDLDADGLVDVLLAHPRTAETIVEKLWLALVSDTIDQPRVMALAADFRAGGYQMKPLLRALLLQDAVWTTPQSMVRSPVDLVVTTARLHRATLSQTRSDAGDVVRAEHLAMVSKRMGQDLFDPPTVKGWPTGAEWITTATVVARDQFLRSVGRSLIDVAERDGTDDDVTRARADADALTDATFQTR